MHHSSSGNDRDEDYDDYDDGRDDADEEVRIVGIGLDRLRPLSLRELFRGSVGTDFEPIGASRLEWAVAVALVPPFTTFEFTLVV